MPASVSVLVVAHASPPLGGPGVRRLASWMREWPALGLEPALLTSPPEDGARFHGYPIDPASAAVLEGRAVVRVATPLAGGFARFARALHLPPRLAWTLAHRRLREREAPWGAAAIEVGVALARRVGARVVVSTSQPYVDHVVGRAIARACHVPWLADFRDPMTETEGRRWPTRWHRRCEAREERAFLRDADAVWVTARAAADRFAQRFPESAGKVTLRRNGVGPDVARAVRAIAPPPPLRIGHLGRFTDGARPNRLAFLDVKPGGRAAGTGSSPEPLYRALALVLARRPALRERIVFVTVGNAGEAAPPDGVVHEAHGFRPHAEAVALAAGCHALYLPLTTAPPFGSLVVPQKTYEYAALGRPVLVSGTAREASDLLGPLALVGTRPEALAAHVEALLRGAVDLAPRPQPAPLQSEVAAACARDLRALATRA